MRFTLRLNETDQAKAIQLPPADLPGGHSISFENSDPVQRFADVRVNGLNLLIDPAEAVVTVSLKPGILLVWLGIAIGVLGGLIALVRRTLDKGRVRLGGHQRSCCAGWAVLARFAGDQ